MKLSHTFWTEVKIHNYLYGHTYAHIHTYIPTDSYHDSYLSSCQLFADSRLFPNILRCVLIVYFHKFHGEISKLKKNPQDNVLLEVITFPKIWIIPNYSCPPSVTSFKFETVIARNLKILDMLSSLAKRRRIFLKQYWSSHSGDRINLLRSNLSGEKHRENRPSVCYDT